MLDAQAEFGRTLNEPFEKAQIAYGLDPSKPPPYFPVYGEQLTPWSEFNLELQRKTLTPVSLMRHAIVRNDMGLLTFILDVHKELQARKDGESEMSELLIVGSNDLNVAMSLGRIEMIGEIITRTGAGIPLEKMIESTGVELKEKPTYYTGLTVRGSKRKDWAEQARGHQGRSMAEKDHSLLLRSVYEGCTHTAEYFLSDAPTQRYLDFAKSNATDSRIQGVAQAPGGLRGILAKWWKARSQLIVHMAVMSGPEEDGSSPMLQYVLETAPDTIEAKDSEARTPLLTAVGLRRITALKTLIGAGAVQSIRDRHGHNAMHLLLKSLPSGGRDAELLPAILEVFDQKLLKSMFLQRSAFAADGRTPLATALYRERTYDDFDPLELIATCKAVFKITGGDDLAVLNADGDYIVHMLARGKTNLHWGPEIVIKWLIDYRPEMLHWENATGMTPLEIAETRVFRDLVQNPPKLPEPQHDLKFTIIDAGNHNGSGRAGEDSELARARRQIDAFLSDDRKDLEGRSGAWRMHQLLLGLVAQYPGKRKLVSVMDANEVAKRLAEKKQRAWYSTKDTEESGPQRKRAIDEVETDEVQLWWHDADSKRKCDWEMFKKEVLGEKKARV
jgi:hypothetical protein